MVEGAQLGQQQEEVDPEEAGRKEIGQLESEQLAGEKTQCHIVWQKDNDEYDGVIFGSWRRMMSTKLHRRWRYPINVVGRNIS
jgi:hypothetical protein